MHKKIQLVVINKFNQALIQHLYRILLSQVQRGLRKEKKVASAFKELRI
jgi:hypothetical protein